MPTYVDFTFIFVTTLLLIQDEYQGKNGSGMCENLTYAVERLVRGLSSNRAGARQGFAVCLTEVSNHYTSVAHKERRDIL